MGESKNQQPRRAKQQANRDEAIRFFDDFLLAMPLTADHQWQDASVFGRDVIASALWHRPSYRTVQVSLTLRTGVGAEPNFSFSVRDEFDLKHVAILGTREKKSSAAG